MSIEKFEPSYDIYQERFEKLKNVIPEAFEDGKINWAILKEALGDFVDDGDVDAEHYAFTWPGKREACKLAGKPPQGTLVPAVGEGVDEDKTENIFIEGDNLEVLKLLQKSYVGKIKMIYIDPPYNTGNDFIYNDNYTQPLDEYLKLTGQIDEAGNPMVSNKKADGRFHSKWLNMMYPRLLLSRSLLRDDGVIFISIDDNEIDNLKKSCNEIFGEENFIGVFVVNSTPNARDYGHIGKMHEYALFYAKDIFSTESYLIEEENKTFKYEDEIGGFNVHPLYNSNVAFTPNNRPNLFYPFYLYPSELMDDGFYKIGLENKQGAIEISPSKSQRDNVQFVWRWGKEKAIKNMNKEIIGYKTSKGEYRIVQKMRHTSKLIRSLLLGKSFSSRRGTAEVEALFNEKIFSFPKPVDLIMNFLMAGIEDNDIVLDYFSGSATLVHALFKRNAEAKTNNSCISIQLPEAVEEGSNAKKAGYNTISDIGKERIKKVIREIKNKYSAEEVAGQDLGFKVFKLQKSHFKEWQDYKGQDVQELMTLFSQQEDVLVEGWKKEDLLVEVMLREGFPLHSKVSKLDDVTKNEITKVENDFCDHLIYVCLDKKIEQGSIDVLPLNAKDILVCLDSALTDEQKVILADKGVIKTV